MSSGGLRLPAADPPPSEQLLPVLLGGGGKVLAHGAEGHGGLRRAQRGRRVEHRAPARLFVERRAEAAICKPPPFLQLLPVLWGGGGKVLASLRRASEVKRGLRRRLIAREAPCWG